MFSKTLLSTVVVALAAFSTAEPIPVRNGMVIGSEIKATPTTARPNRPTPIIAERGSGDDWAAWGKSVGDAWAQWGESVGSEEASIWGRNVKPTPAPRVRPTPIVAERGYGNDWAAYGSSLGSAWAAWGESVGSEEASIWGRNVKPTPAPRVRPTPIVAERGYGSDWAAWGESLGDAWAQWGESVGSEEASIWGRNVKPTPAPRVRPTPIVAERGYGNDWAAYGSSLGSAWAAWGESVGSEEASIWGRNVKPTPAPRVRPTPIVAERGYGSDWAAWGESLGDAWAQWGESVGSEEASIWGRGVKPTPAPRVRPTPIVAERGYGSDWAAWGESLGDAWAQWGESVGSEEASIWGRDVKPTPVA